MVQQLLAAGADVSGEGGGGATALHAASEAGAVEVVRALINAGADIDRADDIGTSPLYATCQHGHFHVAEALLEAGCHVDGARDSGATPLMIACRQVRLPAVPRHIVLSPRTCTARGSLDSCYLRSVSALCVSAGARGVRAAMLGIRSAAHVYSVRH